MPEHFSPIDSIVMADSSLRRPDDVTDLLELVRRRPPWHASAACRGVGPDIFYPQRGAPIDEARSYCQRCAVTVECAAAGMSQREGIWGGMSGRGRRNARRARDAAA